MSAKDDLLYAVMHANTNKKGDFTGEQYRDELKENAAKEPSAGGSGGGAQVQTNYAENDPTSPAYMQNRPFHDAWSSVACSGAVTFDEFGDSEAPVISNNAIVAGKTYTFAVDAEVYTGVAKIEYNANLGLDVVVVGDMYGDLGVAYVDVGQKMLVFHSSEKASASDVWCVLVEGDSIGDTVTWIDNTVGLFSTLMSRVSENTLTVEDLANGYTLACIGTDGAEVTLTEAETTISEGSVFSSGYGVSIQYGGKSIVDSLYEDLTVEGITFTKGTYLQDQIKDTGTGYKCIGLTINKSTAFAPKLELKKIPEKFLPGVAILYADAENYLYATEDTSDTSKRITAAQLKTFIEAGRAMYLYTYDGFPVYELMTGFAFPAEHGVCAMGEIQYYTAEYTAT